MTDTGLQHPEWFDPEFYLARDPAIRESGLDPWKHYLEFGHSEGRKPSAAADHPHWFDPDFYVSTYPEVADCGLSPWDHYLRFGFEQGRWPSADRAGSEQSKTLAAEPEAPEWFDAAYYLDTYPEVRASGMDPWKHFLDYGYIEGRRPTRRKMHYDFDGLSTQNNCDFMQDPAFVRAYNRGSQSARGVDHHWYWRFHVGLWCLRTAMRLPGDFVEFGVNYGMLASGGMLDLDWNAHDKSFYLFESFGGMKPEHIDQAADGRSHLDTYNAVALSNGFYATDPDEVRANFAEFHNVHLIVGFVPDTLEQLATNQVAFVHIDMNNPTPEVLALRFVWDRIVSGGIVLLDDYAQKGFELQKSAMDAVAREIGFDILALPTGQGLILKT